MKTSLRNVKSKYAFIFAILFCCALVGCKKPPTEGVIKVVDLASGAAVAGAQITYYVGEKGDGKGFYPCNSNGIIEERVVTAGSNGSYTECFKHPVLITIEVTSTNKDGIKKTGLGSLGIVDQETKTTTIKIN